MQDSRLGPSSLWCTVTVISCAAGFFLDSNVGFSFTANTSRGNPMRKRGRIYVSLPTPRRGEKAGRVLGPLVKDRKQVYNLIVSLTVEKTVIPGG